MQAEEDERSNSEGIQLLWNYILEGVRRCCGLHFQRGVINEARKGRRGHIYKFSGQLFLATYGKNSFDSLSLQLVAHGENS